MKPFNLALALAGKPVQLRTGQKAVILYYIPEVYKYEDGTSVTHPLRGIIFNKQGKIITANEGWTEDGAIALNHEHNFDIIGMWEEPKKQINIEDLPKPFKPKLGEYYYRIASRTIFNTLNIREKQYSDPEYDDKAVNQGNCFRTREDAQKWLDFMKSMKE